MTSTCLFQLIQITSTGDHPTVKDLVIHMQKESEKYNLIYLHRYLKNSKDETKTGRINSPYQNISDASMADIRHLPQIYVGLVYDLSASN